MARKGLRPISCHGYTKVEAGYKPSHTNETLIGYIMCQALFFLLFLYLVVFLSPNFSIIHSQQQILNQVLFAEEAQTD